VSSAGRLSLSPWARRWAWFRLGDAQLLAARQATRHTWAADHTHDLGNGGRFWRSICTSTPIRWTTVPGGRLRHAFMQIIRWDNAASLFERYSKET